MAHDRRSMSQRRSAASSPHRRLPKTATRISARYREPTAADRASTWRSVRTERSGDLSRPAPLMRQGFRRISPSSAAVFMMALSSRYALAVLVGLAPASRRRLRRRWPGVSAGLSLFWGGPPGARRAAHWQCPQIKTAHTIRMPVQGKAVFLAAQLSRSRPPRLGRSLRSRRRRSASPNLDPAATRQGSAPRKKMAQTRTPPISLAASRRIAGPRTSPRCQGRTE